MALEFRLSNGGLQHMTMLNTPMFFAAVPRTFLDKMRALRIDRVTGKPDPEAFKAFTASHPDNRGQAEFLAVNNPPPSYANSAYYGIHTFKLINQNAEATLVRWRFVPQDGEKQLSDAQLKSMPRDFLEKALINRTKKGPARWDMLLTIGEPGDPEDDPTILWPQNRKELNVGTLTIASAMAQQGAGCEKINYDPLVMGDGIEPTADPVLLFRSPSYALSFTKQTARQVMRSSAIEARVAIQRAVEEVFSFYRDFKNLLGFLGDVMAIEQIEPATSRWKTQGPLGIRVHWTVKVTNRGAHKRVDLLNPFRPWIQGW